MRPLYCRSADARMRMQNALLFIKLTFAISFCFFHELYVQCMQINEVPVVNPTENKRYCKSRVYMKLHPNGNLKNIMVLSALANKPFPSSSAPLFQNEGRCSAFDMEITFHSHANKTYFHKTRGCAPSLVLKVRVFRTRKWPIGCPGCAGLTSVLLPEYFCHLRRFHNIAKEKTRQPS